MRLKVPHPPIAPGRAPHEQAGGSRNIVDKPDIAGNPDTGDGAGDDLAARTLISLLFAPGQRPDAGAVEALAASGGQFAVSHRPDDGGGGGQPNWLELLTTGLTFDLHGLAPGAPSDISAFAYRYGLPAGADIGLAETLTLALGPHLAGAEGLLPVVRAAAALARALAQLPGTLAVGWRPARALSGVAHFTSSVGAWLDGGAFPALGLTALERSPDGAMTSEGLAHLIGQELRLEPAEGSLPAEDARLAMRLIDLLVSTGTMHSGTRVEPIAGQKVALEPDAGARLVRARRIAG